MAAADDFKVQQTENLRNADCLGILGHHNSRTRCRQPWLYTTRSLGNSTVIDYYQGRDSNTGGSIAGQFELDWTEFVDYYDKPQDSILDSYNFWMPSDDFHHLSFEHELMLSPQERSSWYVGAKLAALYHLHFYFFFGEKNEAANYGQGFRILLKSESLRRSRIL